MKRAPEKTREIKKGGAPFNGRATFPVNNNNNVQQD
jgi:hypothetical protein